MALSPGPGSHGGGDFFLSAGGAGVDGPGRRALCRDRPGDVRPEGLAGPASESFSLFGKAAPGLLVHRLELQGAGLYRVGGPIAVGGERRGRPVSGLRLGPGNVGGGRGLSRRHDSGHLRRLRGLGTPSHPGHDPGLLGQFGHRPWLPGAAAAAAAAVGLGLCGAGAGGAHQGSGGADSGRPGLGALGG